AGSGLAACPGVGAADGAAGWSGGEPGGGGGFRVRSPASRAAAAPGSRPGPGRAGHPCKVLVIDDEALVRAQLRRSLELRGYVVAEAADGRSGLAAVAEERPDVVILVVTMPVIDEADGLLRLRAG